MKVLPIIISSILLLAAACTEQDSVRTIRVNLADSSELPVDTLRVIPLETSDSSMIYDISDLLMINGELIVHSRDLLRSYNRESGKYIRNIARRGNLEGEFSYIGNLWFSGDTIYFFDSNLGGILSYSTMGEYLGAALPFGETYRNEEKPRQCFELPGAGLFSVNISTDHTTARNPRFTFYPEGTVSGRAVEGREVMEPTWLPDGVFVDTINGRLLSWEPMRDTIFEVTPQRVRPLFAVDFGENAMPEEVKALPYLADRIDEFNKDRAKPYASLVRYVQLRGDNLYFSFSIGSGKAFLACHNTNTGKTAITHIASPSGELSQSTFFKIIGDSAYVEMRNRKNQFLNPGIYPVALSELQ